MKKTILIVLGLVSGLLSGCSESALEYALRCSGDNRTELEKVLRRYKNESDTLKYEAAVFLIENMPFHTYYEGEQLDNYLQFYPILRSVLRKGQNPSVAVDSVKKMYGAYNEKSLVKKKDIETIDSAYLCNNIDWAFKVWREQPWGKNVSFEEFKEEILPYRVGDEKPAYWREVYYNYYNHLFENDFFKRTDVDMEDPVQAAKFISNNVLWLDQLHFTTAVPADLPHIGPDLAWNKCGSCRELSDFVQYAFRALGIPCSVDYMPVLRNEFVGHSWVSLESKSGKLYYQEFLRGIEEVEGSHMNVDAKLKVFRRTFSHPSYMDVTELYARDFISELRIPASSFYPVKPQDKVYLCASAKFSWIPLASAPFDDNGVFFTNLDRGDIMRLAYVTGSDMTFLTDPFYLDESHNLHFLSGTGDSSDMIVYSKMPLSLESEFSHRMVGGVFEGSDYADFRLRDTLYMVDRVPERLIERVKIPKSRPYRYFRYYGPDGAYCNISEVAFRENDSSAVLSGDVIGTPGCVEMDGSHEYTNVYDGNPWTSFNYIHPSGGWAGIGLKERKSVGHISYTHRNMDNYIHPGDTYRLYCCDNTWKLYDELTAESDSLVFRNVPSGLLYLLVDMTRGKQAAVFSYSDGHQVWEHF